MKIVDAYWEKRNFGITTQELIVEDADTEESISDGIGKLTAQYQVVKLPVSQICRSHIVTCKGFSFIETMVHLDVNKNDLHGPFPSYGIMSASEREIMLEHIASGIFHTDRFSLDPFFSKDKVANRYVNVVHDEMVHGAVVLALLHEGEVVGFTMIRKAGDSTYVCPLSGIYPEFIGKKLGGTLIVGSGLAYIEDQGGGELYSGISTNNTASMRSHIRAGYKPNAVTYIFVKHQ